MNAKCFISPLQNDNDLLGVDIPDTIIRSAPTSPVTFRHLGTERTPDSPDSNNITIPRSPRFKVRHSSDAPLTGSGSSISSKSLGDLFTFPIDTITENKVLDDPTPVTKDNDVPNNAENTTSAMVSSERPTYQRQNSPLSGSFCKSVDSLSINTSSATGTNRFSRFQVKTVSVTSPITPNSTAKTTEKSPAIMNKSNPSSPTCNLRFNVISATPRGSMADTEFNDS